MYKLLPGALLVSLWRGYDARFVENIGNGGTADYYAESDAHRISDLRVAPAEIVVGQFQDESARLFGFAQTPSPSRFGTVVLRGVDVAKPIENGPGADDFATLLALFGREFFAFDGEASALTVREIDAGFACDRPKDLFKDDYFLSLDSRGASAFAR